jgi:hypothetical protein
VEPFTLDRAEKTRLSIKNDSFDQKEIHAFVQFQIAQYHHSMPSTDSIPKMLACLSVQGYLFQKDYRLSIKRQANKEKRTMTTMFASYLSYLPNFTMAEPEILRNLAPCESTEQPNENKANSLPPISSWECSTRYYVPNFTMVEPESRRKPALMGGKRASKTEPEQFASYLVREYSKSYMFQLQCGGTRNILASRSQTCIPSRILGIPKIVCLSSCQGNMQ